MHRHREPAHSSDTIDSSNPLVPFAKSRRFGAMSEAARKSMGDSEWMFRSKHGTRSVGGRWLDWVGPKQTAKQAQVSATGL